MGLFKDFTKNLGATIKDAALNGLVQGIRQSEIQNRYGSLFGVDRAQNIEDGGTNVSESFGGFNLRNMISGAQSDQLTNASYIKTSITKSPNASPNKFGGKTTLIDENRTFIDDPNLENSDVYKLGIPQWGYDDFINERNIFIKNFTNGFADPGWMYFKIFFNFNTQHGLFGGLLNHEDPTLTLNGAYKYLAMCQSRYKSARLVDRAISLRKFANLLSYINCNSPWFFKSVKNLNNVSNPYITEFTGDNKSFEIELAEDAIDMRISTLFSMYKFACYDDINCREIIPENLRKFDMCIVIFSSPLKTQHTPIESDSFRRRTYKKLYALDSHDKNTMSFKLYNFLNCEFDRTTLGGYTPGDLTNDNPFQMGKNTIKINYDRVYEYVNNEFTGDFLGSDAYYWISSNYINVNSATPYSNLTLASEKFINDNINSLLGKHKNYALGNLFWQDRNLYTEYSNKKVDKENTGSKFLTDFAKAKYGMIKGNNSFVTSLGYNLLYKWLGASYQYGSAPGNDGTGTVLNGEGQLGVGSAIWNSKMNRIKYGPKEMTSRERRMEAEYNAATFDLKHFINKKATQAVKTSGAVR